MAKKRKPGLNPQEQQRRVAQAQAAKKPRPLNVKSMVDGVISDILDMIQRRTHLKLILEARVDTAKKFLEAHPFAHNQLRLDSYTEARAALDKISPAITEFGKLTGQLEDAPNYADKMVIVAENYDTLIHLLSTINQLFLQTQENDQQFQQALTSAILKNRKFDHGPRMDTILKIGDLTLRVPTELSGKPGDIVPIGMSFEGEGTTPTLTLSSASPVFIDDNGDSFCQITISSSDVPGANTDFSTTKVKIGDGTVLQDITVMSEKVDGQVYQAMIALIPVDDKEQPETGPVETDETNATTEPKADPKFFTGDLQDPDDAAQQELKNRSNDVEMPINEQEAAMLLGEQQAPQADQA